MTKRITNLEPDMEDSSDQTKTSHRSGKITTKEAPDNREIEIKIAELLEAFPFYVMLVDEDHHILQANSAVRDALGVDRKAIVGKYCPLAVHGLSQPIDRCPLEEAVITNQPVEREIFDPASRHWIRSSIYPIKSPTADGRRIFFHMIADISDRKQAEENLRVSQQQLRELALHLQSAREEERTRLAREIHDELGQLLTALKIDVSWMAQRLPKAEGLLVEKAKTVNELIDEALQTVKRVSYELRPGVLDHLGLEAAIEWQAQELGKRTEIRFEFKPSAKEIVLDRDRSTTIFRICQEAMTNVVRHAKASKVKITLKEEPGRIVLRISDDGKGIKEKQLSDPKSFGLIGMRERARSWGGDVKISGSPGKGTVVIVSIPLINRDDLDAKDTNRG